MLTHMLLSALDTVFSDLQISPELQNLWALPKNHDQLIVLLRQFKTRTGDIDDPDTPQPQKREVGINRDLMRLRAH